MFLKLMLKVPHGVLLIFTVIYGEFGLVLQFWTVVEDTFHLNVNFVRKSFLLRTIYWILYCLLTVLWN